MKNKGITLVALIITIIILLILAGITIGQLTGNGIFENAKTAKEKWENAQEYEQESIEKITNSIDFYANKSEIYAKDVSFTPTDPSWTGVSNVKQALDYLYEN